MLPTAGYLGQWSSTGASAAVGRAKGVILTPSMQHATPFSSSAFVHSMCYGSHRAHVEHANPHDSCWPARFASQPAMVIVQAQAAANTSALALGFAGCYSAAPLRGRSPLCGRSSQTSILMPTQPRCEFEYATSLSAFLLFYSASSCISVLSPSFLIFLDQLGASDARGLHLCARKTSRPVPAFCCLRALVHQTCPHHHALCAWAGSNALALHNALALLCCS